ncbi:hypothetical protein NL676_000855 [Syzygium grande]|nr:hypothetical protein NL676_000855 [Syzygium grande]
MGHAGPRPDMIVPVPRHYPSDRRDVPGTGLFGSGPCPFLGTARSSPCEARHGGGKLPFIAFLLKPSTSGNRGELSQSDCSKGPKG